MKSKWIVSILVLVTVATLVGCVPTVDGRREFGMPFVKDSLEARYERTPMEIWSVAKEVLKYNGQLYSEDVLKSTLDVNINPDDPNELMTVSRA